jgi:SNF2 family DNA or RNA helicase
VFCLRRTKDMMMNGRPLLSLTPKMITLRELRLSERERLLYDQLYIRGREACNFYNGRTSGGKPRQGDEQVWGFTRVLVVLLRLRQLCDHPCLIAASAEGSELKGLGSKNMRQRRSSVWLTSHIEGEDSKRLPFGSMDELVNMVLECCQAHMDENKASNASATSLLTARIVWSVLESACGGITIDQVKSIIKPALSQEVNATEKLEHDKFWDAEVDMDALADSLVESNVFEYQIEEKQEQQPGELSKDRELWDPLYASTKVWFTFTQCAR